jgi:hypothetical protein
MPRRLVAALAAGTTLALTGLVGRSAADTPDYSTLHPLAAARLLDTRIGLGAEHHPVSAGQVVALAVTGRGGVPATGVSAVVLNVTVTAATDAGVITVSASDDATSPDASSLNYVRGQTVPNLVVARVGTDGQVDLTNTAVAGSSIQLVADVSGYYLGPVPASSGVFGALPAGRLLDTRDGTGVTTPGPIAADGTVELTVAGQGGVPDSGVSAVVLTVTATGATATGSVTAYASGDPAPTSSTGADFEYVPGRTGVHTVVAPVGDDGMIDIVNQSDEGAEVQLVVDVSGYYLTGRPDAAGGFGALPPGRVLDTERGVGLIGVTAGAVPPGGVVTFQVTGHEGVPIDNVSAVVLNVTASNADGPGVVAAYASGKPKPTVNTASNLNYIVNTITSNLVIAPVGADGRVNLVNFSAQKSSVQLRADVTGYYLADALDVPAPSTSRYVRNIDPNASDKDNAALLHSEGCDDAREHPESSERLSLLDIGAQTTRDLSAPGVLLSATERRITNAQLVAALKGYLAGYEQCNTGKGRVTIAVGTNNDGDFAAYPADQKATDWATQVIEPLRLQAADDGKGITLAGAVDTEAAFASTEAQAETWITTFLDNTPADLIENGSADACPIPLGATDQDCDAVGTDGDQGTNTWSQQDYYQLAHGLNPDRIRALPQIYVPSQAGQWANISLTGAADGGPIDFLGTLSQEAACGTTCSLSAERAWSTLWYALSTNSLTAATSMPIATDLRADGP